MNALAKTMTAALLVLAACGGSPFVVEDAPVDAGPALAPPPPPDVPDAGSDAGQAGDSAAAPEKEDAALPACAPGACVPTASCQAQCSTAEQVCDDDCTASGRCSPTSCQDAEQQCASQCQPTCEACATAGGCRGDCATQ